MTCAFTSMSLDRAPDYLAQCRIPGLSHLKLQRERAHWAIKMMAPDADAVKAGMKVGDVLLKIDGTDPSALNAEEAITLMRGYAGENVDILVQREGKEMHIRYKHTGVYEGAKPL